MILSAGLRAYGTIEAFLRARIKVANDSRVISTVLVVIKTMTSSNESRKIFCRERKEQSQSYYHWLKFQVQTNRFSSEFLEFSSQLRVR